MEFVSFSKIPRLHELKMQITQKIHGSNAQICIWEDESEINIQAGSRTKWIYPGKNTDNYGFAAWVEANRESLIEKLGLGTHYGEWAGPGINSGEGLTEKTLCLFDVHRYRNGLPEGVRTVPLLYEGTIDLAVIDAMMDELKINGSRLVPGFMRPEGIVVTICGKRYKYVFEPEETKWTGSSGVKAPKISYPEIDYSYLMQPIRLEKLLSRDEMYLRDYPKSLGMIVQNYVVDLIEEGQIVGDADAIKATKKNASRQIFSWVKEECCRYKFCI